MATQPMINPHTGQPVEFRRIEAGMDPSFARELVRKLRTMPPEVLQRLGITQLPNVDGTADGGAQRGQGQAYTIPGTPEYEQVQDLIRRLDGFGFGQSRQDYNVTDQIQGPDGQVYSGTPYESRNSDREAAMGLAAFAAMAGGAHLAGLGQGGGAAAGAAGGTAAGSTAPVWNAALAESAIGTAGYGASSAGAGGLAAGAGGTLAGTIPGSTAASGALPSVGTLPNAALPGLAELPALGPGLAPGVGEIGAAAAGAADGFPAGVRPSSNYGPGLSGTQTSAYDTVMNTVGSPTLANVASNVAGAVDTIGGYLPNLNSLTGGTGGLSDWLRLGGAILPAIGGIATRPDAAQTGLITDAAQRNADMGGRQQQIADQQFGDLTALFEQYRPLLAQQITQAQGLQQGVTQAAADEWADYRSIWRPVQNRLAEESLAMANPAFYEQEAQRAAGDVTTQFDRARTSTRRQMEQAGLSQDTIAQLEASSRLSEAKAVGGATDTGRREARKVGMSYLDNAARFGRNTLASATQLAGMSSDLSGRTGQAINNMTLAAAQPAQITSNLYQGAVSANNAAGNLASQANRDRATSDIARSNATLGGLAGSARIIGSLFGP